MIKFLAAVILVSLATQSRADDTNQAAEQPVLYEYLRGNPIRLILDFVCGIRDFLKDPALTNLLLKIRDSLPDIADQFMTCGKTEVFNAMNKRNSSIGQVMSILRLGNQNEITKLSDIYSYFIALPFTFPSVVFSKVWNTVQLDHEMDVLFNELRKKCANIIPNALKNNYDALATLSEKYNYGGH